MYGFVYIILVYWVECGVMDVFMCSCVFLIRNFLLNSGVDVAGRIMYTRPILIYIILLPSRCYVEGPCIWINSSSTSSSAGATVHDEPWLLLRLLAIGPDPVTSVSNF
jgi:hypothetical protein